MRRVLREKEGIAKPWKTKGRQAYRDAKMNGQEPLSVFRRPEPAATPKKRPALSAARRLTLSRALAAVSAAVLVGIIAMDLVSPTPAKSTVVQEPPARAPWIEVTRRSGAFELASPQLSGLEPVYLTRRHRSGDGRQDVVSFGTAADTARAFVQLSIYRPGSEGVVSLDSLEAVAATAANARIAAELRGTAGSVLTKFGELATVEMQVKAGGKTRNCLAAAGRFDDPALGLVIWYCNPGEENVALARFACLLDRVSLASSGGSEKLIDFFAKAERNRSFCDARNSLYGHAPSTPDWIDTKASPVLRKLSAR
jgi:hypothetical protein